MRKYTYNTQYYAHLGLSGDRQCIVPDQVARDQKNHDNTTFPVIVPAGWRGTGTKNSRKMRVRLVGDDYDLFGPGTGDMVVRPLAWASKH